MYWPSDNPITAWLAYFEEHGQRFIPQVSVRYVMLSDPASLYLVSLIQMAAYMADARMKYLVLYKDAANCADRLRHSSKS